MRLDDYDQGRDDAFTEVKDYIDEKGGFFSMTEFENWLEEQIQPEVKS